MQKQISEREDFYRRVLELPDEGFSQIKQYLDDMLPHLMSSHIPNDETIAAIKEADELAKLYCSRLPSL